MSFPSHIERLPAFEGPFAARRLEANDCEVLFAQYPAGTSIEPHSHETHDVGVITAGQLILDIDGRERRYGVGSVVRGAEGGGPRRALRGGHRRDRVLVPDVTDDEDAAPTLRRLIGR